MAASKNKRCFLIRIELLHTHRPIWREVILPSDLGLDVMHDVIQDTMGWADSHLHQFKHKGRCYESPEQIGEEVENPEFLFFLDNLLKRAGSRFNYTYDFGDSWDHSITLKKTLPWDEEKIFTCTGGEGACPLEDCGGPFGHERICRYLENPDENDDGAFDYADWVPEGYDPHFFDLEKINENLKVLKLEENEELNAELFDEILADRNEDPEDPDPGNLPPGFENLLSEDKPPAPYHNLSESDLAPFKTLFDLGSKLRQCEPWKKLWDQDIFGIRDPESGLLDFVSVLGRGGEVFSIHVHRPPESYDLWEKTQTGVLPMHDIAEYLRHLRMVELQFSNNRELEDDDLELYDKLEIPPPKRGKNQWMQVRRYHPRSIPWFAKPDELPPLVRGAALTLRMIDHLRADPKGPISTFYRHRTGDGNRLEEFPVFSLPPGAKTDDWDSWQLEISDIDWKEAGGVNHSYQPSEFELERIASLRKTEEIWEAGAIHLPGPVVTENGPVIPILGIAFPTERLGEAPVPYVSTELSENSGECLWKAFFQTVTQRGERPAALHVSTQTALETFETLAKRTGMRVEFVDKFTNIGALFAMVQSFDN